MKIITSSIVFISKAFSISSVPITSWSSEKPNIIFPKIETFLFLCLGLFLFGLGESILVVSQNGVTPWTVLAEGVAKKVNIGIGLSTFIISCIVLVFDHVELYILILKYINKTLFKTIIIYD